jgi:hypothetical protein
MDMLGKAFPASNETKKLDIVLNGEIEMSQFFLRNDFKITCIEWPDLAISNQTIPPISSDIKTKVKARHYFYHRMYFRKNKIKKLGQIIPGMVLWMNFVKQGL